MIRDTYLISFLKCHHPNLAEVMIKYFILNSDCAKIIDYNKNIEMYKSKGDINYYHDLMRLNHIFIYQEYTNETNTFSFELFKDSKLICCLDTEDIILEYEKGYHKQLISLLISSIDSKLPVMKRQLSLEEQKKMKDMMWDVEYWIEHNLHNEEIKFANDGRVTVEISQYQTEDLFNGRYALLFEFYPKEIEQNLRLFEKGQGDRKNYEAIVYYHALIRLALEE